MVYREPAYRQAECTSVEDEEKVRDGRKVELRLSPQDPLKHRQLSTDLSSSREREREGGGKEERTNDIFLLVKVTPHGPDSLKGDEDRVQGDVSQKQQEGAVVLLTDAGS